MGGPIQLLPTYGLPLKSNFLMRSIAVRLVLRCATPAECGHILFFFYTTIWFSNRDGPFHNKWPIRHALSFNLIFAHLGFLIFHPQGSRRALVHLRNDRFISCSSHINPRAFLWVEHGFQTPATTLRMDAPVQVKHYCYPIVGVFLMVSPWLCC